MSVRRHPLSVIVVVIVGTGLSALAAVTVARQESVNYRLQFQRETDSLTTSLQRSINRYTDLLLAMGDLYSVSSRPISRDEFNRFVARSLTSYPGIQALEWAPIVTGSERPAFEAAMRKGGYADFKITERPTAALPNRSDLELASERDYYAPVTYLQPWAGNELALGYDLTSDATRRAALEAARDAGRIAASGRIRLVQERKNQFGFLVFLPMYEGRLVPPTPAARREKIEGYLLGVFRVSDVVEESLETLDYDVDFTLSDRSAKASEQFLGTYRSATRTVITQPNARFHRQVIPLLGKASALCPAVTDCIQTVAAGDRQWAVEFFPAASYPASITWRALATLVIGLLLTVLVARSLFQAQAELQRTREVSELKIRLFSMASHELRTPLSTILLSAQMLENTPADASTLSIDRQRIQSRIRAAAKQMNRLLNDLLLLARAESGKLAFSPEIVNLTQLCQQLIEEVRFSFEVSPPIELIIVDEAFDPRQPIKEEQAVDEAIYADPQLLRAIVTNLLSNAVKYSQSKVILSLFYRPHEVVLQVQDSGIGILEVDRARLVETFYRGANVGDIAGTGLGLSVVNACLQLHKGRLSYESKPEGKTTFTVAWPRVE